MEFRQVSKVIAAITVKLDLAKIQENAMCFYGASGAR
jgi:hypothetical protein